MKKIIDKPTDFLKSIIKDYEYSEENNQRDKVLKFAEKFEQNKTTMNKNSINVHPPELNLVHESNVKNLGNVRMSNNVVIQKGSDLVTKGNDKVLNLSTDSRQQKSSIKHNTVLMGQRKLLSEKEMEGTLYYQLILNSIFSPKYRMMDRHDITEILLKVALNSITPTPYSYSNDFN